jgi:hypothetical protein
MSTYSPDLRIELIANGAQPGTWGTTTNNTLSYVIDPAITGFQTVSVTSANQALTYVSGSTATASANQAVYASLAFTTTTAASFAVYAPPNPKQYIIWNNSSYTLTIYNSSVIGNTTAAGTGVAIPASKKVQVFSDGTNFYAVDAANLTGTLAIANGGTGQTTQQTAINALAGATTSAQFLRGNGTNVVMSAIQVADVPTLNQNTTGTAAGLSATLAVASGGTGLTSWSSGTLPYNNGTTSFASSGITYDGTNMGLAYTAESWAGAWRILRVGATGHIGWDGGTTFGTTYVVNNAYFDGTDWVRNYAGNAPTYYRSYGGSHIFGYAASGAAGSTFASFTNVATIDSAGVTLATGNFVGNASTATSTPKIATTNFTIEESGGKLIFKYGATTIASMTSAGVLTTLSDVIAGGTP